MRFWKDRCWKDEGKKRNRREQEQSGKVKKVGRDEKTGWVDGWRRGRMKKRKTAREVKSGKRAEKTCKPKADGNKLIMQHKMLTFMTSMKLAEALK